MTGELGKLKTYSNIYLIEDLWENCLNLTHTLGSKYFSSISVIMISNIKHFCLNVFSRLTSLRVNLLECKEGAMSFVASCDMITSTTNLVASRQIKVFIRYQTVPWLRNDWKLDVCIMNWIWPSAAPSFQMSSAKNYILSIYRIKCSVFSWL